MPQYFNPDPNLKSDKRSFPETLAGERFYFFTESGTFSRDRLDFATRLMLETAIDWVDFPSEADVLDLACGWGPVATVLLRFFPNLNMLCSDVNERALALVKENVVSNNPDVENLRCVLADGVAELEQSFDLIFLNPPIRAGKQLVYRLFAEACEALRPGGSLFVVMAKKQGAKSGEAELKRLFGDRQVEDVARKAGFHVYLVRKEGES